MAFYDKNAINNLKLGGLIREENRKIDDQFMLIGKAYYAARSGAPDAYLKEYVDAVTLSYKKIEEYKEQQDLNKGIITCPSCKTKISSDSLFCNVCGNRIVNVSSAAVCRVCGARVSEGQKFCVSCGTPIVSDGTFSAAGETKPTVQKCECCGADIINGQKFCTACGNPVPATAQNFHDETTEKAVADNDEKNIETTENIPTAIESASESAADAANFVPDVAERVENGVKSETENTPETVKEASPSVAEAEEREIKASTSDPATDEVSKKHDESKCPLCGTDVTEGNRFCIMCGYDFQTAKTNEAGRSVPVCPTCGASIAEGNRFCTVCGTKLF